MIKIKFIRPLKSVVPGIRLFPICVGCHKEINGVSLIVKHCYCHIQCLLLALRFIRKWEKEEKEDREQFYKRGY